MFYWSICQILNIGIWQLILGFGSVIIATIVMFWQFNRARKTDFKEMMEKKADKEMVLQAFQLRDQEMVHVKTVIREFKIDINQNIQDIKDKQDILSEDFKKMQSDTNKSFMKILEKI